MAAYTKDNSAGPPLTGTYAFGDTVTDSNGVKWTCQAPGTPGIWTVTVGEKYVSLKDAGFEGDFDFSGNSNLVRLDLSGNTVESLDLSGCASLESFTLDSNDLLSIDLTGCSALQDLELTNTSLTALDVSDCDSLTGLTVTDGALETIVLCPTIENLILDGNSFVTLDTSAATALTSFQFVTGSLTSLTISGSVAMSTINVRNQPFTTLDISGNPALLTVYLLGNALSVAGVNAILTALDAAGLSDGIVDLSGGTNGIPSGAGATAKTALEGKGWTVTVNS